MDFNRLASVIRRLWHDGAEGGILVVEDDANLRELERRTLEKEGWSVTEAENGKVALARLAESRPALILLDLLMPEMDGFEFLDVLRQRPEWSSIPVVVITARELTGAERAVMKNRVESILEKGAYGLNELLDNVRAMVSSYVARGDAS